MKLFIKSIEQLHKTTVAFSLWCVKHIQHKQLLLILSFVVGVLSGLAAILLKNIVHAIVIFFSEFSTPGHLNFHYFLLPVMGIIITVVFVRKIIGEDIGHGVSRILYAISKQRGYFKPHNNYSSIIASSITVSMGGSAGLEAPIVLTGASIGSTIGRLMRQNYKTIILLIACGATGAIAGIFKAPIAGCIFALEILMLDLTLWSVIPLLISSVTAASLSYFFLGKDVVFSFSIMEPFPLHNLPYYLLLGVFCGLIAWYFMSMIFITEEILEKIHPIYWRVLAGSLVVGLLVFLFPPLYGEGYIALKEILTGNSSQLSEHSIFHSIADNAFFFLFFLFLIIFLKVIATSFTTGSGGIGGVFAPALFVGGVTGTLFAKLLNMFSFINVSEYNFALVGMAGVFSGVLHAPLTAIFLIAELTNGYELFLPLIIVSAIAYVTENYFQPHSIYTRRLAKKGELLTHHKDKNILLMLKIQQVIETDFATVYPDDFLGNLVGAIADSRRNIFPVVDNDGKLLGIVNLDDIRDVMFNQALYNVLYVKDLMNNPKAYIEIDDTMDVVMRKFEMSDAWNLPVIDKDGKYMGFISKSKIFTVYRNLLLQFSDE